MYSVIYERNIHHISIQFYISSDINIAILNWSNLKFHFYINNMQDDIIL